MLSEINFAIEASSHQSSRPSSPNPRLTTPSAHNSTGKLIYRLIAAIHVQNIKQPYFPIYTISVDKYSFNFFLVIR